MSALRYTFNQWTKRQLARRYLAEERALYALSQEAYWQYVIGRFAGVYDYARTTVPYYREEKYPRLDFSKIQTRADLYSVLGDLPILQKATVKANNEAFLAPKKWWRADHTTSGTSGSPLRIRSSLVEKSRLYAIKHAWYGHVGARPFPRMLLLSGGFVPKPGQIGEVVPGLGHLRISIYDLIPENRQRISELMERVRPEVISGYASAVHLLAQVFAGEPYAGRDGCVAITTAEVLQPDWRPAIENNLARTLRNYYSSQEGAIGAFELTPNVLSLHPHMGIMEVLDEGGRPSADGSGACVQTGLLRQSMPLIRYAIRDHVEGFTHAVRPETGVSWPSILGVGGRSEDLVRTRSGARVGYLAFHSTKQLPDLVEAQIVQRDYEVFDVHLVVTDTADRPATERHIRGQMEERLKTPLTLHFHYPDFIPRGANDKFKAVVVDFSDDATTVPAAKSNQPR